MRIVVSEAGVQAEAFHRPDGSFDFDTIRNHFRNVAGDEVEAVEGVQLIVVDLFVERDDI